jgi:hypothetical protein
MPDITLLEIENWTALGKSVKFSTVVGKLNSSTSYTISDSTSGLSLNVVGTGFKTTNFFGYNLLATGTITGFTLSLHGEPIVEGSNYSLSASQLLNAVETSVFEGTALPFFDVWFSIPTIVSGAGPIVAGNLANLLPEYLNIAAIDITSGAVSVPVANFEADRNVLDKISGGFVISDASANVQAGLALLQADVGHINSIHFTNASPVIQVTAAQNVADAGALKKITSPYVLDVHNTTGSWTTTGHGNGLAIHDMPGAAGDTITGGGSSEDFFFGAGFGKATLTDFHNHLTGSTHDTLTLAKSEFGSLTELLNVDAKQFGTSVLIHSGADLLTVDNMTVGQLKLASADIKLM